MHQTTRWCFILMYDIRRIFPTTKSEQQSAFSIATKCQLPKPNTNIQIGSYPLWLMTKEHRALGSTGCSPFFRLQLGGRRRQPQQSWQFYGVSFPIVLGKLSSNRHTHCVIFLGFRLTQSPGGQWFTKCSDEGEKEGLLATSTLRRWEVRFPLVVQWQEPLAMSPDHGALGVKRSHPSSFTACQHACHPGLIELASGQEQQSCPLG